MERLKKKKNSGIKVRKKDGQKGDSSAPGSDVTRRQRLDLKGPRVKHVCRSASIVLGQPQATFPLDKRVEKIQVKPIQGKVIHTYTALV
jgi:histone-lysine N-methyltransferase MLL1